MFLCALCGEKSPDVARCAACLTTASSATSTSRQYEATGGKVGHDWNGTSCLILHTSGRKTGQVHKFPLIYGRDGDDYVIIASKGGAPDNPGWYENLVAHPDVEIQVWDKVIPVTARTGTAADKQRVWPT